MYLRRLPQKQTVFYGLLYSLVNSLSAKAGIGTSGIRVHFTYGQ
jgi:hypothetical protein